MPAVFAPGAADPSRAAAPLRKGPVAPAVSSSSVAMAAGSCVTTGRTNGKASPPTVPWPAAGDTLILLRQQSAAADTA